MYILQSTSTGKFYVGNTNNLDRRAAEHNSGGSLYTRGGGPWELVYCEEFEIKRDAIIREREIKARRSRKLIEELIGDKALEQSRPARGMPE